MRGCNMVLNHRGFSIVELVAVMAIMAILFSIAALSFNDWSRKAAIEAQTRTLQSDLNSARLEAITGKRSRAIVLNPGDYSLKNYTSVDENITSGGTIVYTKTLNYQIKKIGGVFSGEHIVFNSRGFVEGVNPATIITDPSYSGAAFDCIVTSFARNNIGKVEKVSGNDKCVPK